MLGIFADIYSFFDTKLTEFSYAVLFFLEFFIVSVLGGLEVKIARFIKKSRYG